MLLSCLTNTNQQVECLALVVSSFHTGYQQAFSISFQLLSVHVKAQKTPPSRVAEGPSFLFSFVDNSTGSKVQGLDTSWLVSLEQFPFEISITIT